MDSSRPDRTSFDEATKPVTRALGARAQAWQDSQTREALGEADAGLFATHDEVVATIRKFVRSDEEPAMSPPK